MEEEEESPAATNSDPVIKEIPIFLSKRLSEQLYMFQYPLKPRLSKNEISVKKSYFKPNNQEVKLETEINPTSKNFDLVKAEEVAQLVDGSPDIRKTEKEKCFENNILDKMTLTSTKIVKDPSKYAVGVYNGREYHLTPLKGFLQLRPSLAYLDNMKRKRDASSANNDSDDEAEAGPSNAEQVTVKFARTENDKLKKNNAASYKKLQEKSSQETWMDCTWQALNSTYSEVQKQKLFAENMNDSSHAMNVSASDYIRMLVPEDQEQAQIKPSLPSNVVSLHALRELPILEQCKFLLKDVKIIQFQQLMVLLGSGETLKAELLLKDLSQVAVLVRGNWIVKSEVLYPNNTFSSISGVPADLMCKARDYVLYQFTKNQFVERRKVSSVIKIPPEEIKEILTGISKLHHHKMWQLILSIDTEFINEYNEVVIRQNLMWEQRAKQLNEYFTENKEKTKRRKSKSVSEENKSSKRDSISSDNESGTEKNKSPVASRKSNRVNVDKT